MKQINHELVDAFFLWYNDYHYKNENYYQVDLTHDKLSALSRAEFVEFFFQFSRAGGKVQSGGQRTAGRFRKTIEAHYDDFRAFALEPFSVDFDEIDWLSRIGNFNGFGKGLATIYLNRVDNKRFTILNNKAVEAFQLMGASIPSELTAQYKAIRNAELQLMEWYPEFKNLYQVDALTHFLIGTDEGKPWKNKLSGPVTASPRYWLMAPGREAEHWDTCLENGVILYGADQFPDLTSYDTKEKVSELFSNVFENGEKKTNNILATYEFAHVMKEGDIVIVKKGLYELLGYGRVTSGYRWDESRDTYRNTRDVDWISTGEWPAPEGVQLVQKTLTDLTPYEGYADKLISVMKGKVPPGTVNEPRETYRIKHSISQTTFDLLAGLSENPTAAHYSANQDSIKQHVEIPVQDLMKSIRSQLPDAVLEVMETEKRLFSRIIKNDWGRGGAWDFYWGAFYPKGGKRIEDAQLFIWINRNRIGGGFFMGRYSTEQRERFLSNCNQHRDAIKELLSESLSREDLIFGESDAGTEENLFDSIPNITFESWLQDPGKAGLRCGLELELDEVLELSPEELTAKYSTLFREVFPLVILATSDQPLRDIAEYLGHRTAVSEDNPVYTMEQCAAETYLPLASIKRWVASIERKKQAIFYGPPGTGKTFVAEKLSRHLIGGADGLSEIVQFHPSYAYEDFIQGLRPKTTVNGTLEYAMVPGRFKDFCSRARECQGTCVLIVDEINRANLARVMGELMYLLEYRRESIPLSGGEQFRIPENVRIIGTMNTADRSIALVDHALRRRFAFIGLYPDYEVLAKYHADNKFSPEGLIGVLEQLNAAINDKHYSVGISFFLQPEIESNIEDIWQMEIEPYVEELFFDQPDKAKSFSWEKVAPEIV